MQSKLYSRINLASLWKWYPSEVHPLPHLLQSFLTQLEETWTIHSYVSFWNCLVCSSWLFLHCLGLFLMLIQISTQPKTWGNPHETLQASLSVSLPHLQCSVPKILAVFLWIVYPLNLQCSKHACLKSSSLRCGLETASIHLICENIGLTLFNFQVSQFCSAYCPMSENPCFIYFTCFSVCFFF